LAKFSKTLAKFIEFSLEKEKNSKNKYPLFFQKNSKIYPKKKPLILPNNPHLEKKG